MVIISSMTLKAPVPAFGGHSRILSNVRPSLLMFIFVLQVRMMSNFQAKFIPVLHWIAILSIKYFHITKNIINFNMLL